MPEPSFLDGRTRRAASRAAAVALAAAWLAGPGCRPAGGETGEVEAGLGGPMSFALKSSAFDPEGTIPKKFTCDGPDVSPALRWGDPPKAAASFALVMDDPDAPRGTWVHWVLFDLPATVRELNEGVPADGELNHGARQGRNDFGRIGYGGPCPPPGKPHRYVFKLYALDRKLGLAAAATKAQVEKAIEGHVLAKAEIVGRYGR